MQKFIADLLFGMAFGVGFILAYAVLRAIINFLSGAQVPHLP